jgi:hypothetical protein
MANLGRHQYNQTPLISFPILSLATYLRGEGDKIALWLFLLLYNTQWY